MLSFFVVLLADSLGLHRCELGYIFAKLCNRQRGCFGYLHHLWLYKVARWHPSNCPRALETQQRTKASLEVIIDHALVQRWNFARFKGHLSHAVERYKAHLIV
jgi:hypothetical protein